MSINISQLKNEIQKGLRAYKAFEEGEKVLSQLEGIAQEEKQLKTSIEALKSEEADLIKNKKKADVDAEAIMKRANEFRAESDKKAKNIVDDAHAMGSRIVNEAKAKVSALMDDVEADNKEIAEKSEALKKEAAEVEADLSKKKEESNSLKASLAKHKASLEKIFKGE